METEGNKQTVVAAAKTPLTHNY